MQRDRGRPDFALMVAARDVSPAPAQREGGKRNEKFICNVTEREFAWFQATARGGRFRKFRLGEGEGRLRPMFGVLKYDTNKRGKRKSNKA